MIYLKEYKEYSYYQEITAQEFFIHEDADIKEYFNRISRWLLDNKGEFEVTIDLRQSFHSPFKNIIMINYKNIFNFRIFLYVDKDEWFYVKIEDEISIEDNGPIEYYKCDQLDGFFQLIKDKLF